MINKDNKQMIDFFKMYLNKDKWLFSVIHEVLLQINRVRQLNPLKNGPKNVLS